MLNRTIAPIQVRRNKSLANYIRSTQDEVLDPDSVLKKEPFLKKIQVACPCNLPS